MLDLAGIFQNVEPEKLIVKTIVILIIFISTVLLSKITKGFVQRRIEKAKIDITQLNFIKHFLSGAIYFIGFSLMIFQIDYLRSFAVSILASSGIMAVIIGFASQQTFANLVSGLFITFFKPFRIGDRIRFIGKDTVGIVEDITLRHTVIRTFENRRIIIPNNVMNNEMIENANIIEDKTCSFLDVGISYDSDINKAMDIISHEIMSHKHYYDNRTREEIDAGVESVSVKVIGLGDSSVNIRAWVWAQDPSTGFLMLCDLYKSVKERFDSEGIEIPYPHRTIAFKNQETKPHIVSGQLEE